MHAERYEVTSEELRRFVLRRQYQNGPIRLLAASLAQDNVASLAYSGSNLQKFLLRQIKAVDKIAFGQQGDAEPAAPTSEEEDDEHTSYKPTKLNGHLLAFYGQGLLASKSYQSSICELKEILYLQTYTKSPLCAQDYLLRAYEVDPDNLVTCLSTGIAYLHRAMQRQTDNRQHQLAQALAFLDRYRKLRGDSIEVEYNLGRAFNFISK